MAKFDKLLLVLITLTTSVTYAQDIHFSQYNQAPLALNPALTGNYACDWRAGINYRDQWNSVPAPYTTYSFFLDAPVIKGIGGNDKLAAGIYVYNDVSGDGNLSNFSALLSVAYHKALGSDKQYLSLGVQSGIMQKKIDWQNLLFANQFDGTNFNPNLNNFEPISGDNFMNLDLNAGLAYNGTFSDKFSILAGVAGNHLTAPNETFLDDSGNKLGTRITGHLKATIGVTNNFAVTPSFLYMTQSGASETLAGVELGYYMKNPNFPATFYLGGHYRINDAVIPDVGIDYKNFKLGISYDVNTSNLNVATGGKGGVEISLVYTGCILPVVPDKYILPCVRY